MIPKGRKLEQRVVAIAEDSLARKHTVSVIDVFVGVGMLLPVHVERWHKGTKPTLDGVVQAPSRLDLVIETFFRWGREKGLKENEAHYHRSTRQGTSAMRAFQNEELDRASRVRFDSPHLTPAAVERISEKTEKPKPPVVFQVIRDSECTECGVEIEKGDLLYLEAGQALCMPCANFDALEFLPAGDVALTRRSTKYSTRHAVVVRFSRSRKRYERQGILAEPEAIERAEQECLEDAPARAGNRRKAALARGKEDREFAASLADAIRKLYPRCPLAEAERIAAHTAVRGSGRVGRSAAARRLDERALTLAVAAAIRHRHTNYDELLASGVERTDARNRVRDEVDGVLDDWR